jgi:SAM-dependent methyltransferase
MACPDPTRLLRIRDGVYASDLLTVAVVELGLFDWIEANGPCSQARLGDGLGLAPRPCDVLVTYLVALGLLERDREGRLLPTPSASGLLRSGSPTNLGPYFASLRERPACGELLRVLRTGEPEAWASAGRDDDWAGRLDDPEFARRITAAMDARGAVLAPALASVLADLPCTGALDVGGGSGVYARALVAARDELRAAVLERPPVDAAARTILRDHGEERVDVITGDMFTEPLPTGFDLHLFSHVLHDWDEHRVRRLLAASYAALCPGGWLVDHDAHINADKSGPLPVAEYSVLVMHSTSGKCWSTGELGAMLAETGFTVHDHRPTVADRAALIARKPH